MAIVAKKIQDEKTASIKELKDSFGNDPDFIFTEYRGLSVEKITNLRKLLREKEAVYKVVKNNFARLAFEELSFPDVSSCLVGPTAIAVSPKDSNEIAKILLDFAKEAPVLKVKGALIDKKLYDAKQIEEFSRLPGRLELISMLMSVMQGPTRNLAACLNDVPTRLVRVLQAVADKKSEESAA
ncbi:MAG: 50S ribosomal protein L10 [Spirochaetaceae bacterium]|jgi:large subunit ribosomal protein L10|nr:50S ribosomal protein L10 [Spirochaetaceae bacterium]